MRFDEYRISSELKTNLAAMGFVRPTDIQFKTLPHIQKGEDLLAIAQTGTGKTAAFAIPVIDKLQFLRKKKIEGIKCIVMVPTRELALQITEVFHKLGRNTKLRTFCVYGGVEQDKQIAALENGIDILVTTPGRLFDLSSQGYIHLNRCEILILDEADRMLALGFYEDIEQLIQYLPKKRQTLFFSATIDDKIKKLAYSLVNTSAIRIQISPKDPVSKNVAHAVAFIEMDDKRFFLERLITENSTKKMLVFVRTKVRAERVKSAMERVQIETDTIHGDKDQREREAVLSRFKTGDLRILIATDVSARGIDIPHVDFVINYDLPDHPETYVHRIGRTGRGKQKGQAVSFCAKEEKSMLNEIETYITKPVEVLKIEKSEYHETISFKDPEERDWKKLMEGDKASFKKKKR
ncbi:MAG: DEAD/DEAH box helicase [Crocinitomicaceae bacterium]|nr:DEAD/DEAH box helicase [Crocinitomicaceae bacterium]MBK8927196.1 DEAD/DEAH box helicase [Crocinitomicaceae bacterium]